MTRHQISKHYPYIASEPVFDARCILILIQGQFTKAYGPMVRFPCILAVKLYGVTVRVLLAKHEAKQIFTFIFLGLSAQTSALSTWRVQRKGRLQPLAHCVWPAFLGSGSIFGRSLAHQYP